MTKTDGVLSQVFLFWKNLLDFAWILTYSPTNLQALYPAIT